MNPDYWQQQKGKPLFPNIIWSRPETKNGAGKLLIIGGQAQEFSNVAACYIAAEKAGAGTVRVIMPNSTEKATRMLGNIEYAPANNSGSFASNALSDLLDAAAWADGVLIAGDLGKNSETSLLLDAFANKITAPIIISNLALETLKLEKYQKNMILTFELADIHKYLKSISSNKTITSQSGNLQIAETLHFVTKDQDSLIIYINSKIAWAAYKGRVISTQNSAQVNDLIATIAVWAIQQPAKQFESVISGIFDINN